jgi:hypothetical protein
LEKLAKIVTDKNLCRLTLRGKFYMDAIQGETVRLYEEELCLHQYIKIPVQAIASIEDLVSPFPLGYG